MGQRSVISMVEGSASSTSPVTFQTWPLVMSPTGTEIGAPVSRTSAPRCMPSVGFSAMQRTMLSPMCSATSMVMVVVVPPTVVSTMHRVLQVGHGVDRELDVDDGADDAGDPAHPARGVLGGGTIGDGCGHGSLTH